MLMAKVSFMWRSVPPALAELEVREPYLGAYSRDTFGQKWSDDVTVEGGHNGCDTRNDVLRKQLEEVVVKPGTRVTDPYSGERVAAEEKEALRRVLDGCG